MKAQPPGRRIVTERLVLRPFEESDLDELVVLHEEPEFWWFPFRRGRTRDETEQFLRTTIARYETDEVAMTAATLRSSGELIGWIGLSVPEFLPEILPAVEVGWRLGRRCWSHGYATEGASAAMRWGRGLGLGEVVCIYEPANVRSARVCDRLGFGPVVETTHPTRAVPLMVRRASMTS